MKQEGGSFDKAIWLRLSLLGVLGASSLLLAPLEQFAPPSMPVYVVRLLSLIQPTLLVLGCAALGAWLAPKVGLNSPAVRAWADSRPVWPELKPQVTAAVVGGLIVGALLILFWQVIGSLQGADRLKQLQMPLLTKILYGGIVEELLVRWGLMSFLVWMAWRISGSVTRVPRSCFWVGTAVAAAFFSAGHLPVLYLLVPDPPNSMVALVLVGNAVPGLLFGWLYWRRGLEAAMIAHGLAHVFSTVGAQVLT